MGYIVKERFNGAEALDMEVADEIGLTPNLLTPAIDRFREKRTKTLNKRLHGAVYKTLGATFFGIMSVWTITFWNSPAVLFNLGICFIYLAMYLGGPIMFARARGEGISDDKPLHKFLKEPFDTYTGIVTGGQAWVQICLIPVALLVCTIAMGVAVKLAV